MSTCPVCQEYIHDDSVLLEVHVNSHFDAADQASQVDFDNPKRAARPPVNTPSREAECPICEYPLLELSHDQAQAHVVACLDEQTRPDSRSGFGDAPEWTEGNMQANAQPDNDDTVEAGWEGPARPGGWADWVSKTPHAGDKWWDPVEGSTDSSSIPSTTTPGALPALKDLLVESSRSFTISARLSTEVTHIKGSLRFDFGWGCGYRNALMLISALMVHDSSHRRLFERDVQGADPGVRRVQGWIEEAWGAGYDREGCGQLRGKVLGTRKWIGTSDLYSMFSYLGVPCHLVDFPKPGKNGSTAVNKSPAKVLIRWVKGYFDDGDRSPSASSARRSISEKSAFDVLMRSDEKGAGRGEVVRQTRKLPLILQHNGHSRTIVGYEETQRGTYLLLFDPGRTIPKDIAIAGLHHIDTSRQTRRRSSGGPTPPRKPSHSSSHESIKFTRPYTNGASEPVLFPAANDNVENLHEDEYITPGGWVRKKVSKVTRRGRGDEGVGERRKTLPQLLSCFRVSEESLSKFKEYQVLAFTGEPLLSLDERERKKVVTSTVIRQ